MLDKLRINNMIVHHKKQIRQSKIQVFAKLVQKVRKLKTLQEKHPGNESNKNKLRKSIECLEEMKKLNNTTIMKRILLLESNPSVILTNALSTSNEMVIAYLASNKLMQELIKKISEYTNLKDSDKTWKKRLLEPSKKQLKTLKTEIKREKRKQLKSQKELERKRHEWIKENTIFEIFENKNKAENVEVEIERNGSLETSSSVNDLETNKKKLTKNRKDSEAKRRKNLEVEKDNQSNIFCSIKKKKQKEDISEDFAYKQTNVDSNSSRVDKSETEFFEYSKINSQKKPTHTVDSFFFTSSGENYLAATINDDEKHDNDKNEKASTPFLSKLKSQPSYNVLQKRKAKSDAGHEQYSIEKQLKPTVNSKSDPDLHPSWIAKQKLKPTIALFQGKKTTFD